MGSRVIGIRVSSYGKEREYQRCGKGIGKFDWREGDLGGLHDVLDRAYFPPYNYHTAIPRPSDC